MVKKETWKGKDIFTCESCHFGYATKLLAEQCEQFCQKHHSCSLEITQQAVKK